MEQQPAEPTTPGSRSISITKRSPTVAPSVARLRNESALGDEAQVNLKMRSSVSCDNYLGEVAATSSAAAAQSLEKPVVKKIQLEDLCEREVAVTTPSPIRWAAKAEELLLASARYVQGLSKFTSEGIAI